jgi:hypothetical protein
MNRGDITKTIVQYTDVCPLGLLLPRQYYSTRSTSSSYKISGSAVKAILTDFYCKILSIMFDCIIIHDL